MKKLNSYENIGEIQLITTLPIRSIEIPSKIHATSPFHALTLLASKCLNLSMHYFQRCRTPQSTHMICKYNNPAIWSVEQWFGWQFTSSPVLPLLFGDVHP
jgi:hypothetical protein